MIGQREAWCKGGETVIIRADGSTETAEHRGITVARERRPPRGRGRVRVAHVVEREREREARFRREIPVAGADDGVPSDRVAEARPVSRRSPYDSVRAVDADP